MKYVAVKFDNYYKVYYFMTDLDLVVSGKYKDVVADDSHRYSTPITVIGYVTKKQVRDAGVVSLRKITKATPITPPKESKTRIKNVYFNVEKGVTVVHWSDDVRTKVACQEGEAFDPEKGIALCYMKRLEGGTGKYNDIFKQYILREVEE